MTEKPGDDVVAPPPPAAPEPAAAPIEVLHRRAPRYGRFIVAGLLLGALASFLLAILTRGSSGFSAADTFWLLLLSLGLLGMLAGAGIALVLDRRSIAGIEAEVRPAVVAPPAVDEPAPTADPAEAQTP